MNRIDRTFLFLPPINFDYGTPRAGLHIRIFVRGFKGRRSYDLILMIFITVFFLGGCVFFFFRLRLIIRFFHYGWINICDIFIHQINPSYHPECMGVICSNEASFRIDRSEIASLVLWMLEFNPDPDD